VLVNLVLLDHPDHLACQDKQDLKDQKVNKGAKDQQEQRVIKEQLAHQDQMAKLALLAH